MKYGVLGTGTVGQTLAGKLIELDHEVMMGSRQAGSEKATAWAEQAGEHAGQGDFEDTARFGEALINATSGVASLDALHGAGAANLAGKLLIDVANPIAPGSGMPPSLAFCNTESLGERIQRAFPDARVVKTLNTINASVMTNPRSIPGRHNVFVSGDDDAAKAEAGELLQAFGWPAESVVDLGDISTARGAEMYLALWLRLMIAGGTPAFNIAVVSAP
jgi:8-hydroxy-5-deazaflavin:NADPH oxidoreductase